MTIIFEMIYEWKGAGHIKCGKKEKKSVSIKKIGLLGVAEQDKNINSRHQGDSLHPYAIDSVDIDRIQKLAIFSKQSSLKF